MLSHRVRSVLLVAMAIGLGGCQEPPESPRGFRLPEGDPAAGRIAFVEKLCHGCHSVSGVDLPDLELGVAVIELGGQVTRVKTYGDLVTSIINPSHRLEPGFPGAALSRDGESRMPAMNETLTVRELVDLVSFLQSHYEVVAPRFAYPTYEYPPPR